nr:cytochrome P450 3A21-like isoform X1 [Crassostrea gigas]
MDMLGKLCFNDWILVCILLCMLAYLYSRWKHSLFRKYGIPGPLPTPFVGISPKYRRTGVALTDLELARTYGDIVGVYMGHRPLLLVSNPDTIKAIMVKEFSRTPNRPKTFLPRNEMKYPLLNADDDQWRFLRNTLLPTFSSGKMRMMEPLFKAKYEQLLDNLTERVKTGKPIDFKDVFGAYTLDVVASTGFRMDIDSQKNPDNDFVKNTKKFVNISFTPILILNLIFPKIDTFLYWLGMSPFNRLDILSFFRRAVKRAVDQRMEDSNKPVDLLQLMLNAHHDTGVDESENIHSYEGDGTPWKTRSLTMDEIVGNSILFLLVGYDTTSNALAFTAYNLATHPDCQEKLIDKNRRHSGKGLIFLRISHYCIDYYAIHYCNLWLLFFNK